jgi:hypothetical protein
MARDPQNFSHNNQLSTSAVTVIEAVPTNTKQVVRKLSFRNTGASTRTVTVYVVGSGGTAGITNELQVKAIPAGKEWGCTLIQAEVFNEGMSLQAKQDAGTDVNVNCSGVTVT